MTLAEILNILQAEADQSHAKTLNHFAINVNKAFGIKLPVLRNLAKAIGKDTPLAMALWGEGHHEGKLLATLIARPEELTLIQLDDWVNDIYSWDVCDQLCINLLVKRADRWSLPARWIPNTSEYVRRVGLVMIVALRIHDKRADDKDFEQFFPLLKEYATDERNFVKKAVNWTIRELGKRSVKHHPKMIGLCHELLHMDSKAAIWSARDALRELEGDKVKKRLGL
jgi:3-methyladenine DNA glycosylase AlkD